MAGWILIGAEGRDPPPSDLVSAALAAAPQEVIDARTSVLPLRREPFERCRICGADEPLTREHVPPRAAGNTETARTYGITEWLKRESLDEIPGGRHQQGGNWGYTLCGSCNSTTGRYSTEYRRWAGAASRLMTNTMEPPAVYDADTTSRVIGVEFPDAAPGSFVRQVLVMMMTAASGWGLAARYPDLRDAVLTGEATTFPDDLFLGVGLTFGPTAMTAGPTLRLDVAAGAWRWSSIVVYPPFAFELTLAESDACEMPRLCGIGGFFAAGERQRAKVELDLPLLFSHSALPFDWRTKAQIERHLDMYGQSD